MKAYSDMDEEIKNANDHNYRAGFWAGFAVATASTSVFWLILYG